MPAPHRLSDAARPDTVELTVEVIDGTAIAGTDYAEVADFVVTITAGETEGTESFTLVPLPDETDEPDKTLLVRVRAPAASGLSLDAAARPDDVTLTLTVQAGTATEDEDFAAFPLVAVTLAAGTQSITEPLALTTLDDNVHEAVETVTVTATVTDDDFPSTTVTLTARW